MKKYQIKKIDPSSVAKIYLAFGAIFGLLFGGIAVLFTVMSEPSQLGAALAAGFFPILFGALIGAGITALSIWLYNRIAERIGGVIVYLTEDQHLAPGPIHNTSDEIHDDPTLL